MMDLDYKFIAYHQANPQVYNTLVRLARDMKRRGYRHLGIKMLWETMRFKMMMTTVDTEGFKLNNIYTSRYARLIMQQEPDLMGIFETRTINRRKGA